MQLRRAIGDYSPDESGDWREAVVRYGKGHSVRGEVARKMLRDQRNKDARASGGSLRGKLADAPKKKPKKK